MITALNQELITALHAAGEGELEVVDPETLRTYVLIDSDTHHRAMDALRRQQDHDAIAAGLVQLKAGEGQLLDEAFQNIRTRLGLAQTP